VAERRFDLGIGRELAALGFGETFENAGQVGRVYLLELTPVTRQRQHGARNFILTVRGQLAYSFESFF
jgi:hypothetical protein